jgi:DNA-binding transcriptional MerR regulator
MTEYSKRDIASKLGRSHRNITYWTDFGLVIPDVRPSQGRGIARIYSERNLIEFGMIDIMVKDYGISLDSIQYILRKLRDGSLTKISGMRPKMKTDLMFFEDFYTNRIWGEEKDLMYLEHLHLIHDEPSEELKERINEDSFDVIVDNRYYKIHQDLYVKDPGSKYEEIFKMAFLPDWSGDAGEITEWKSIGGYMKIIWLAGVRNSALNKIGVTLPPYDDDDIPF